MLIFVSEYVTGGAWSQGCPEGSLRVEGAAMLTAVAADFARIPGCRVTTTWDRRLGPFPVAGVDAHVPRDSADEQRLFREQAAAADATLVIAPEFHDLLAARCEAALEAGGTLLGPSPRIVRLCGDKLALAEHLNAGRRRVPIIPTRLLEEVADLAALPFPIVLKPRHGAGSTNTFLARDAAELARIMRGPFDPPALPPDVWQPFIAGRSLSASAIAHPAGASTRIDVFPAGEQELSDDGRFAYRGGRIPADGVDPAAIESLIRQACAALGPGLSGYLGFDLLVPHAAPRRPLLVEINPRLTTSYLGYRELAEENLAARLLPNAVLHEPIHWRPECVEFTAASAASRPGVDVVF